MILMIDNYDSFTFNLVQALEAAGAAVQVVRNDAIDRSGIEALADDESADLKGIVISPGPGRPEDAGISVDVIRRFGPTTPILGVCLGHQAIGVVYGGIVCRAQAPMHGKTSTVVHDGKGVFAGLGAPFQAGRYHSLVIPQDGLPKSFVRSAWVAIDGTVMGIRHETLPVFGVQFHPESVLTPVGQRLLQNFLEIRG